MANRGPREMIVGLKLEFGQMTGVEYRRDHVGSDHQGMT
jgi:hypothetical protein